MERSYELRFKNETPWGKHTPQLVGSAAFAPELISAQSPPVNPPAFSGRRIRGRCCVKRLQCSQIPDGIFDSGDHFSKCFAGC
jgi:hypothetical protein